MAKITEISAWGSAKVDLTSYGNAEFGVNLKVTLEEGDDADAVRADVLRSIRMALVAELKPIAAFQSDNAAGLIALVGAGKPAKAQVAALQAGLGLTEHNVIETPETITIKTGSEVKEIDTTPKPAPISTPLSAGNRQDRRLK